MKKSSFMKMLSMILVLVCMSALVACGGKKSEAIGTYALESVSMGGVTVNVDDFMAQLAQTGADTSGNMSLELKDGGKFVLDLSAMGEEASEEGTWTEKDKTITLKGSDDTEITATYADGKLTLEEEGMSMIFTKK